MHDFYDNFQSFFLDNVFFFLLFVCANLASLLDVTDSEFVYYDSFNRPTSGSDEMDIITFYNELSSLVQRIHKHNVLIIDGDMNTQIGQDE